MQDQVKIQIVQKLETYTADAFGTFCLLYFEEVHRSFSSSQPLDSKILALLDYCVRKPGEIDRLWEQLFPNQPLPQPTQSIPAYQLSLKHYFDLRNLVNRCYHDCDGKSGIFVFALREHSQQLMNCLSKRLIEILGPAKFASEHATVNLSFKNTKAQLDRVRRLKSVLQQGSVVLSFIVADQATFDQLWGVLKQDLGNGLPHTCIVLVGLMTQECTLPEEVIELTSEPWSKPDLVEWVIRIGQSRSFPQEVIDFWKEAIWHECHINNEVDIDSVYAHMDFALRTLYDERATAAVFYNKLRERYHVYAASAD